MDIEDSEKKIVLGLYGAGGFGREVMPFLNENISSIAKKYKEATCKLFFVETDPKKKEINEYPVISEKNFYEIECIERLFNVAIADSAARERIANQCIAHGARPISIKSPHAIVYGDNEIGEGAILCANTIITSNVKIGKFFHSNFFSYVAHDCIIDDYVTFAPHVCCNGNVHIKNHAYIGAGAVIKQGSLNKPLVIGEYAVVGMGAVVTKDVPPFATVVGNPAKPHQ
jgi:sugar O-acyltransferase (sialic acid O-acetyltransferase NeuD family)